MKCPRCKSENVTISMTEIETKTVTKKKGILEKAGCGAMILGTGGLWALTPSKKESTKGKTKTSKIAICQECGNSWKVF